MAPTRLRPAHSTERLAEIYATPHQHGRWSDHRQRVKATIALTLPYGPFATAADLSAGDGTILNSLPVLGRTYLGDYAPGYELCGPLDVTIRALGSPVDLFVHTETLEHVDDPQSTLALIRQYTSRILILSTPVNAWDDKNPEHYWAWSAADVEDMAATAGFFVGAYEELPFRRDLGPAFYDFGIWALMAV